MINITEAKKGDCVWCLLAIQSAPVYGEIQRVIESEGALEVFTTQWGNRVVIASNAYWEEKVAKKGKMVKIKHNYKQWAQEYFNDEETENNSRVDPLHHGKSEEIECEGENLGNDSVQVRPKRKQKVVRKSAEKKRKTRRNRKTRGKKE